MRIYAFFFLLTATILPINNVANDGSLFVSDQIIGQQRAMLKKNTKDKGFGPQSPRDIDSVIGNNKVNFNDAPPYTQMNLCNIHFHKNAEHRGGEFTKFSGNGDGQGYLTGYQYSGRLIDSELSPANSEICPGRHGSLNSGDTIEVHYVHTTASVSPGPGLEACFNDATENPQLRVETQIYVLVNDKTARDFVELTKYQKKKGFYQALHIPDFTGNPVQYAGSTTGPDFNEEGSPFQVTWSVRPRVAKIHIESVGAWCRNNVFNENHAHGVRNLVINPALLSNINRVK